MRALGDRRRVRQGRALRRVPRQVESGARARRGRRGAPGRPEPRLAGDARAARLRAGDHASRAVPSSGTPARSSVGLAVARGEWIALVNDDCLVEPDALVELLAARQQLPGDRLGRRPDSLRRSSGQRSTRRGSSSTGSGSRASAASGSRRSSSSRAPVEVGGASGTLGLYRRAMLDDVGGFDADVLRLPRGCRPRLARTDGRLALRARAARDRPAPSLRHSRPRLGRQASPGRPQPGADAREERDRAQASRGARPDRRLRPALRRPRAPSPAGRSRRSPGGSRGSPSGGATGRRAAPGAASSSCRGRPACAPRSRATASTGPVRCEREWTDSRHSATRSSSSSRTGSPTSTAGTSTCRSRSSPSPRSGPRRSSSSGPGRATPTARSARRSPRSSCRPAATRSTPGRATTTPGRTGRRCSRSFAATTTRCTARSRSSGRRRSTRRRLRSPTGRSTCSTSTAPIATRTWPTISRRGCRSSATAASCCCTTRTCGSPSSGSGGSGRSSRRAIRPSPSATGTGSECSRSEPPSTRGSWRSWTRPIRGPATASFFAALGSRIAEPARQRLTLAAAEQRLATREAELATVGAALEQADLAAKDLGLERDDARAAAEKHRQERERADAQAEKLRQERDRAEAQVRAREHDLTDILRSPSWRMTAPLRSAKQELHRARYLGRAGPPQAGRSRARACSPDVLLPRPRPSSTYRPARLGRHPRLQTRSPKWLEAAVESVRAQTYPHWQLCLADDGSTNEATLAYLTLARGRPVDRGELRRERRDRRGDEPGAERPPQASSSRSSTTTTSSTRTRCSSASAA